MGEYDYELGVTQEDYTYGLLTPGGGAEPEYVPPQVSTADVLRSLDSGVAPERRVTSTADVIRDHIIGVDPAPAPEVETRGAADFSRINDALRLGRDIGDAATQITGSVVSVVAGLENAARRVGIQFPTAGGSSSTVNNTSLSDRLRDAVGLPRAGGAAAGGGGGAGDYSTLLLLGGGALGLWALWRLAK